MKLLIQKYQLCFLILLGIVILVVCPFIGATYISPWLIIEGEASSVTENIFWKLRAPRVLLAAFVGAALAVGGVVFQAVFRNPLASPYTLGVSSGAAFGAVAYYTFLPVFSWLAVPGSTICAFLGAVLTVFCIVGVARGPTGRSSGTLLLTGVVLSFFFASLIIFFQYLSDLNGLFRIVRWLMGGFEIVGFEAVWLTAPIVLAGAGVMLFFASHLDILSLGDDLALSRGVEVGQARLLFLLVASLMVGAVVAVSGPIGFVGIMVPHVCRFMVGAQHRHLLIVSIIVGSSFLMICDTFARTIFAPFELPVGVLTALLGAPFFLWLLLRRAGKGSLVSG